MLHSFRASADFYLPRSRPSPVAVVSAGRNADERAPPPASWNSRYRLPSAVELNATPPTDILSHNIPTRRKLGCACAIIPLVSVRLDTPTTISLGHSSRSRQATFDSLQPPERRKQRGHWLDAVKPPDSAQDTSCLRPPEPTMLQILRLANNDMQEIPDSQGQQGWGRVCRSSSLDGRLVPWVRNQTTP